MSICNRKIKSIDLNKNNGLVKRIVMILDKINVCLMIIFNNQNTVIFKAEIEITTIEINKGL